MIAPGWAMPMMVPTAAGRLIILNFAEGFVIPQSLHHEKGNVTADGQGAKPEASSRTRMKRRGPPLRGIAQVTDSRDSSSETGGAATTSNSLQLPAARVSDHSTWKVA